MVIPCTGMLARHRFLAGEGAIALLLAILLNGRSIAPMPPAKDTAGRPLPIWRACRMLGRDEFFVFSNRIPNSFDSRCYGPIQRAQIFCVRLAIITW